MTTVSVAAETSASRPTRWRSLAALTATALVASSLIVASPALAEEPETYTPTLTVSKTQFLNPAGDTITITGSGFDPTGDSPYVPGLKAGFYAQIGYIDEVWKKSDGAASSARSNAYSVWVQNQNTEAPYLQWTEAEDGTVGFTWTVTVDKAALDAKKRAGAQLAVFTVPTASSTMPWNEVAVPLSFAEAGTLTVSKTSGIDPAGETLTITGSGFDPTGDSPYVPGLKAGFYAQIGYIDEVWKKSDGAASSARSNAYSVWVQNKNTDAPYLQWTEAADGTVGFTWTVTVDKAALDAKKRAGAQLAVFTVPTSSTTMPWNEVAVPIAFTVPNLQFTAVAAGKAYVGQTLTASAADLTIEDAALKYQWLRDGKSIKGATGATYKVTSSDKGKALSVKITATTDAGSVVKTSPKTAKVGNTLVSVSGQTQISGNATVGQRLSLNLSTAATTTTKTSKVYVWYRNGVKISGATKSTYTLTASDLGKAITAKVGFRRSGYTTAYAALSDATDVVEVGTIASVKAPSIKGTVKVGKTLQASGDTWSTGSVTKRYAWYAQVGSDEPQLIQLGSSSKLKLSWLEKGAVISVKVTAYKNGYTQATSAASAGTAVVR